MADANPPPDNVEVNQPTLPIVLGLRGLGLVLGLGLRLDVRVKVTVTVRAASPKDNPNSKWVALTLTPTPWNCYLFENHIPNILTKLLL